MLTRSMRFWISAACLALVLGCGDAEDGPGERGQRRAERSRKPKPVRTAPPGLRLFVGTASNTIREIDPESGVELNTFPVPGTERSGGTLGLAYDGRSLWVLRDREKELFEADPATGAIRHEYRLPLQTPDGSSPHRYDGLAFLNGRLYVFEDNTDALLVVDPSTGKVASTIDITAPDKSKVSFDATLGESQGGEVLLIGTASKDPAFDNTVFLLNPDDGAIVSSLQHSGGLDQGLAGIGDEIFVGLNARHIEVYDRDGKLLRTLDAGQGLTALAGGTDAE